MSEYPIGEAVPVKVFRSSDPGAPKMEAGVKLKTILKACLITGYGEIGTPERKDPVGGWEITAENDDGAVFKPIDVRCGGLALNVAELGSNKGTAVVGMTNAPGSVVSTYNIKPGAVYFPYRYPDENYRSTAWWSRVDKSDWLVVAHETGIFFSFDVAAYGSAQGGFYFTRVENKASGAQEMIFIGTSYSNTSWDLASRNKLNINFALPTYTGGSARIAAPFSYDGDFPNAEYKYGTYFTPQKPLAAPFVLTESDGYFLSHLPGLMASNSKFQGFIPGKIKEQNYITAFLRVNLYVRTDVWLI